MHEQAAAATYAGEADPYRKPRDLDDEAQDGADDAQDEELEA